MTRRYPSLSPSIDPSKLDDTKGTLQAPSVEGDGRRTEAVDDRYVEETNVSKERPVGRRGLSPANGAVPRQSETGAASTAPAVSARLASLKQAARRSRFSQAKTAPCEEEANAKVSKDDDVVTVSKGTGFEGKGVDKVDKPKAIGVGKEPVGGESKPDGERGNVHDSNDISRCAENSGNVDTLDRLKSAALKGRQMKKGSGTTVDRSSSAEKGASSLFDEPKRAPMAGEPCSGKAATLSGTLVCDPEQLRNADLADKKRRALIGAQAGKSLSKRARGEKPHSSLKLSPRDGLRQVASGTLPEAASPGPEHGPCEAPDTVAEEGKPLSHSGDVATTKGGCASEPVTDSLVASADGSDGNSFVSPDPKQKSKRGDGPDCDLPSTYEASQKPPSEDVQVRTRRRSTRASVVRKDLEPSSTGGKELKSRIEAKVEAGSIGSKDESNDQPADAEATETKPKPSRVKAKAERRSKGSKVEFHDLSVDTDATETKPHPSQIGAKVERSSKDSEKPSDDQPADTDVTEREPTPSQVSKRTRNGSASKTKKELREGTLQDDIGDEAVPEAAIGSKKRTRSSVKSAAATGEKRVTRQRKSSAAVSTGGIVDDHVEEDAMNRKPSDAPEPERKRRKSSRMKGGD